MSGRIGHESSLRAGQPIVRCVAIAVILLFLVASCQSGTNADRVPTRDEAVTLLDQAVRLARAGNFVGLCQLGGGNCEDVLATAGREAVPLEAPTVVGDFALSPTPLGNGGVDVGGRVLVLCGSDARSRPYRTEMVVFFRNGSLKAIEPIYWSGMTIGASAIPVTASQPPSASPPISCS